MNRAIIAIALGMATAHAQPAREARVAHLENALAQLKSNDAVALDRALYEAIRTRCKPATTVCMIAIARELCGNRGCLAAADVLVTNQHAERDVLDEQTRMRLVRGSTDYHAAVLVELRARYALLAAELVLARPERTLAAQIDRVCVERDQIARRCEPGAVACLGTVAYQRCAAGLAWFVSTETPKMGASK